MGGEVWILVKDDGKGLDKTRILRRAIEKGIVQRDKADIKDRDIWQLIFQPGFSTATTITDISGRGVGMDVVKRNIEGIHGKVEIFSEDNKGTQISVKIPLTLATIDGMLIRVGSTFYIIPILRIKESLQITKDAVTNTMEDQIIVRIRRKLFPVIKLHEFFNIDADRKEVDEGIMIMVEHDKQLVCLMADELIGQQQVVLKAIPKYLGNIRGVSGCSIMGDGNVCLILDIGGIITHAELGEIGMGRNIDKSNGTKDG